MKRRSSQVLATLVIGISLGWLVGLSLSPVVATLIGAMVGVAVAALGTLTGVSSSKAKEPSETAIAPPSRTAIDMIPLALLVFGLAVGSSAGLYARTNSWLAVPLSEKVTKFNDEKKVIAGLYSSPAPDECGRLKQALALKDLRKEMASSTDQNIRAFESKVASDDVLAIAVENLICSSSDSSH